VGIVHPGIHHPTIPWVYTPWYTPPSYTTLGIPPWYTTELSTVSAVQGVVQWWGEEALGSNPGLIWEYEAKRGSQAPKV